MHPPGSSAVTHCMAFLIPILGDQLSHGLASLRDVPQRDAVVLMMEVADETMYVRHHKRKIVLILSAMRHFANELRAAGWTVDYVRLDDPDKAAVSPGKSSGQSSATGRMQYASLSLASGV